MMVTVSDGRDGIVLINGITIEQYIAYVKARPELRLSRILDELKADGYGVEFIPLKESDMSAPNSDDDKPYVPQPDSLQTMPAEGHAEPGEKMALEITSDPSSMRFILQEMIDALRGPDGRAASRAVALAVTKLQEARFWLGEAAFGGG